MFPQFKKSKRVALFMTLLGGFLVISSSFLLEWVGGIPLFILELAYYIGWAEILFVMAVVILYKGGFVSLDDDK